MRMVGIVDDRLAFVVSPDALPGRTEIDAPTGAILESRHDQPVAVLAQRIARHGGAALIIDYGHATTGFGDTLQAVRGHKFADPLADPGEADLTTQVDFAALARTARREGAQVHGPVTQGDFLRRLGIAARAARLKANATPQQAADIDAALARLTARRPDGRAVQGAGDRAIRSSARCRGLTSVSTAADWTSRALTTSGHQAGKSRSDRGHGFRLADFAGRNDQT